MNNERTTWKDLLYAALLYIALFLIASTWGDYNLAHKHDMDNIDIDQSICNPPYNTDC